MLALFTMPIVSDGQEPDLLSLLEDDENKTNYTIAAFKTDRVINFHSLENTLPGLLDVKISHRFGFINSGIKEFFGIDAAEIRIGFSYGLSEQLTVGVGRSSYEKTYDGYAKWKILRQSTGLRNMPISAVFLVTGAVKTSDPLDPAIDYDITNRLTYAYQLILGRKFSDRFSFQISPTLVHRNLVVNSSEKNDVVAIGFGGRHKLTKRLALNAEYIYVLPDQLDPDYKRSFSIGFDIETGGHVFQLHFTNSTSMIEKGFIGETIGSWGSGDIHFGFNISRVFTVKRPPVEG